MGMVLKMIVAFCIGVGLLAGAQRLWMSSMVARIHAETSRPSWSLPQAQFRPPYVDADKLRRAIMPGMGPIDTTAAQRAAIQGAARRVDIQIRNVQSAVPVPRHFPGMPRY
jgi:hypothetical protein